MTAAPVSNLKAISLSRIPMVTIQFVGGSAPVVSRYRELQVSCCVVTVATTDFVKHWELYACVDTYGRLLDELGTCLSYDCLSNTVHNA